MTVTASGDVAEVPAAAPVAVIEASPDVASVQVKETPTFPLFQPLLFAAVVRDPPIEGAVASRLTVTEFDAVPPALVAEHVTVCPLVSVETVVVPQPVDEEMEDCASVTVHVTVTLLVYQPLLPSVPLTFGVITGGVESGGGLIVTVVLVATCPLGHSQPPTFLQTTSVHVPVVAGAKLSVCVDEPFGACSKVSRTEALTPAVYPGPNH